MTTKATTNADVINAAENEVESGEKTAVVLRRRLETVAGWPAKTETYRGILKEAREKFTAEKAKQVCARIRQAWNRLPNRPKVVKGTAGATAVKKASKATVLKFQKPTKAAIAALLKNPKALRALVVGIAEGIKGNEKFPDRDKAAAAFDATALVLPQ